MHTQGRPRLGSRVGRIVVGVVIVAWSLAPLYWAVVMAFSSQADILTMSGSIIPKSLTLGNFRDLFSADADSASALYQAIASSLIQAVGTTLLTLVLSLPAAYAFARLQFFGAKFTIGLITLTLAVPIYLVMVPLFRLASALGQVDTQQIVIIVLTSACLPLSIWILRSHIASLPVDLEDAARIDGAGTMALMTRIIAPLIAPGAVAAAVVVFLTSWGSFLIPLIYANTPGTSPLTLLIPTFATKYSQEYGLQAAGGLIAIIPPVLLVVFLQKWLVSGLLRGTSR